MVKEKGDADTLALQGLSQHMREVVMCENVIKVKCTLKVTLSYHHIIKHRERELPL